SAPGTRSFFFSSRRRHTRSYGDWSSDVCSSDLAQYLRQVAPDARGISSQSASEIEIATIGERRVVAARHRKRRRRCERAERPVEIGRASCRERAKVHAAPGERTGEQQQWA